MAFATLLARFPMLPQAMDLQDAETWSNWYRHAECDRNFTPESNRRLRPFQQVLIVQALRPDRLQSAMHSFACQLLGVKDLASANSRLRYVADNDMTAHEPVLIVVSEGVDPSQDIRELAEATVGGDRFHEVAMGQGQAEVAMAKLQTCAERGEWLLLKNLHLMTRWLADLEKVLKGLKPHADFRLWLTSEAHSDFPQMLLENSLKLTYESPPGIKQNMLRTYDGWKPETLAAGGSVGAQLLFVLAFTHAVLQERRQFIPQGFITFHEFSSADLRMAAAIITRVCADSVKQGSRDLKWEDIHGLLSYTIYGGRIDSPFDFSVLSTYLQQFFNRAVVSMGSDAARVKLGPGIVIPTSVHAADHVRAIGALPDVDPPAIFGLPANIGRAAERANSARIIDQLRAVARPDTLADAFDRQLWSAQLEPFLVSWRGLAEGHSLLSLRPSLPAASADPVTAFVQLEYYNAIKLLKDVNGWLDELSRVLQGTALLTPDVLALGSALVRSETPALWAKRWDGPEVRSPFRPSLSHCHAHTHPLTVDIDRTHPSERRHMPPRTTFLHMAPRDSRCLALALAGPPAVVPPAGGQDDCADKVVGARADLGALEHGARPQRPLPPVCFLQRAAAADGAAHWRAA